MKTIKDRIENIRTNGYELNFGTVFESAFENYKKIAVYAGLMLLVFSILFTILMMVGIISYIGVENLEDFSRKMRDFSELEAKPLEILLPLDAGILLLSGLLNPFFAGFLKMADCGEKNEEFHVSTMFTYYKSPYFLNIFLAIIITSFINVGLSTFLEFIGFKIIGTILSLMISFATFLTIPFIVFGNLNAIEAIKSSIIVVLKQPLVLLGLIIVAGIGSIIGIFGLCIGIFFTIPFMYSMNYEIYNSIIGDYSKNELDEIGTSEN